MLCRPTYIARQHADYYEVMIMRSRGIEARYAKFGYIFCIPFIIAFILGQLYPLL